MNAAAEERAKPPEEPPPSWVPAHQLADSLVPTPSVLPSSVLPSSVPNVGDVVFGAGISFGVFSRREQAQPWLSSGFPGFSSRGLGFHFELWRSSLGTPRLPVVRHARCRRFTRCRHGSLLTSVGRRCGNNAARPMLAVNSTAVQFGQSRGCQ